MADKYFGQYGGRVLRPFKGAGTSFISGAILTPEMVETWPVANRIALSNLGSIDWFGPPMDDETEARDAGRTKPRPKPKSETPVVKEAPQKKAVAKGRRTK